MLLLRDMCVIRAFTVYFTCECRIATAIHKHIYVNQIDHVWAWWVENGDVLHSHTRAHVARNIETSIKHCMNANSFYLFSFFFSFSHNFDWQQKKRSLPAKSAGKKPAQYACFFFFLFAVCAIEEETFRFKDFFFPHFIPNREKNELTDARRKRMLHVMKKDKNSDGEL